MVQTLGHLIWWVGLVFEIFAFVSGDGVLPMLPPLGETLFYPYKIFTPPPPAPSDLLHPPKHHPLGDLHNFKSISKTLSWGGKGTKMVVSMETSPCKSEFEPFQIRKWMLLTFRGWITNYENGVICLVFLFSSWILFLLCWKSSYFMNVYCQQKLYINISVNIGHY